MIFILCSLYSQSVRYVCYVCSQSVRYRDKQAREIREVVIENERKLRRLNARTAARDEELASLNKIKVIHENIQLYNTYNTYM